eukprot:Pgem_evm1s3724
MIASESNVVDNMVTSESNVIASESNVVVGENNLVNAVVASESNIVDNVVPSESKEPVWLYRDSTYPMWWGCEYKIYCVCEC